MVDDTIWKLDITPGNSQATLKAFENSLNAVKNQIGQVTKAGENFDKLSAFQTKAAEAGKKLEVAQASAAVALKKAQDAALGGKASAEQVALAQAKAGLAAEKVQTAQNNLSTAMNKVQAEGQRLAAAMTEDSEKTSIFTRAIEMAKGALSGLTSGMSSTTSHMSELSSKTESSGGGFLDFASKAGMAFMGVQGLIQGVIQLGGVLLGPIASAEQLGISFTTLMGGAKQAAAEIKELNHFADVTPFEPEPVQQYAAQLIGMGIAAKDVIPDLTSIGDALFGIGHGSEAEMKSVVDILGKIKVAGVMTWGDISQMQTHGIDVLDAMSRATGKTKEALRAMASNGTLPAKVAIDALTKGIEMNPLYKGGMAKQSASLSGVLSTLSGYLKEGLDSFLGIKDGMVQTGSVVDRVKGLFQGLATAVSSKAFQDFVSGAGAAIGNVLGFIGNVLDQRVIPVLRTFWNYIITQVVPTLQAWGHNIQVWVIDKFNALKTFIETQVMPKLIRFWNYIQTQIIPILQQWGNNIKIYVIDKFNDLKIFIETQVMPKLQQLWAFIQTQIVPIFTTWGDEMGDVRIKMDNLKTFIETKVMPPLIILWNWIQANIIPVFQSLSNILSTDVMPHMDGVKGSSDHLTQALGHLWNSISPNLLGDLGVLAASVLGPVSGAFRGLQIVLDYVVGPAINGFLDFMTHVVNGLADVIDWISTAIDWYHSLSNAIRDATGGVLGTKTPSPAGGGGGAVGNFASGVENFGGGLAYVHANEMLVNLPKGASVWNEAKTAQFMQNITMPSPSFVQSPSSAPSQTQGSDQLVGLLTQAVGLLSQIAQQGKGTGNVTMNASVQGSDVNADKLAKAIGDVLGQKYESVARGAW